MPIRLAALLGLLAVVQQATVFAPGMISTGNVFGTTFTPDGRTIYFNRSTPDRASLTVYQSTRTATGWSDPVVAPFSGRWRDFDAFVSPDGTQLWFNSNRPFSPGDSAQRSPRTWVMDRTGDGWGEARPLRELAGIGRAEYFTSTTRNGTLYFTVHPDGTRNSAIVRVPRRGTTYGPEQRLAALDSDSADSNPLVAPDESFLIFMSSRAGGAGRGDLYIAFREGEGWSAPVRLGDDVNTPAVEFAPGLSPDGRTLYFTRMVRTPDDRAIVEENIHSVPFDAAVLRRKLRG
ncbi:MAG TPA: hypothetical protein VFY20_00780 [Gemmatimonadales bacterium]|nr:hypothetical protein [Gemmatimonadales bacterium]